MGWLLGVGALAIPGLGPFIAAGPIMATLAGAGIGGTVWGYRGSPRGNGNSRVRGETPMRAESKMAVSCFRFIPIAPG
jgi:hypothetical protein